MTTKKDNVFDHLVIITRSRLSEFAEQFKQSGFQLTGISKHNLGSINQLIILDSSYIELLGWESDDVIVRKEIANLDYGLDALVFRTYNAERTYQRLLGLGFNPNPVQDLSRPAQLGNQMFTAEFKAIRFTKQPIEGLRIYFCEHLTPELVWNAESQMHSNQAESLNSIEITCADPNSLAHVFGRLLELTPPQKLQECIEIQLQNTKLILKLDKQALPRIKLAEIKLKNQVFQITRDMFNNILGDHKYVKHFS